MNENTPDGPLNSRFVASIAVKYGRELRQFLSGARDNVDVVEDLLQKVYGRLLRVKNPETLRDPEAYLFKVANQVLHEHTERKRAKSPERQCGPKIEREPQ